jgi:hypothetical protein
METELYLKHTFSDSEILTMSRDLARNNTEKIAHENHKKAVDSELKGKIDLATANIENLSNLINNGYEMKIIKCTVEMNKPKLYKKLITRTDTGGSWVEEMTEQEVESLPL